MDQPLRLPRGLGVSAVRLVGRRSSVHLCDGFRQHSSTAYNALSPVGRGSAEVVPRAVLRFQNIAKREHLIGDDGDPKSIRVEKRIRCE